MAVTNSSTAITVSWNAVVGATGYDVFRAAVAGLPTSAMVKISANQPGLSFSDGGLTPSTPYFFTVVALSGAVGGFPSPEVTATTSAPPIMPPGAPSGVMAVTNSSTAITVSWATVAGATGYDVYRSTSAGQLITAMVRVSANQTALSFGDTGLAPSTPYFFKIVALNSAGASPSSSEVTATTSAPPIVPPGAPTGVGAVANSSTAITVSWSSVLGASGYDVYRATTAGQLLISMTLVSSNQPGVSFPDTGLLPSTQYFYKVVARNSAGQGPASMEAAATTSAPPVVPPGAPTGVGAVTNSSTAITVSWSSVVSATGYDVYRSTTAAQPLAMMTLVSSNQAAVAFADTGLTPSTPYFYKVVARNSAGPGPASAEATATTSAPPVTPPAAPTGVGAVASGSSVITVSWTASPGATGYDVYRSTTAGQPIASMMLVSSSQPGVSFADSGLTPSTSYFYRVVARNVAGPGPASAETSASTTPMLSSAKAITAFSLDGTAGVIDEGLKTIAVSMPAGTDPQLLVAMFSTTGASVRIGFTQQTSGVTANDYSTPQTYTVTAADGSTVNYVVTVTVLLSATKAITAFTLDGAFSVINEPAKTISVQMPSGFGTSLNFLVATFTTTGVSVRSGMLTLASGLTMLNYTNPVTLTVTAADGSTVNYVVTVSFVNIGTTWTSRSSGTTNNLQDVAWSGSRFVAVGAAGTIRSSPDGITWSTQTSGTTNQLNGVTWSGTQFVAVGAAGTILTSPDGLSWTARTSGSSGLLNGVGSSGPLLVAVGASGLILTSPTGVTWSSRSSGTSSELISVTWTGTRFVAVGASNAIRVSTNGATWTSSYPALPVPATTVLGVSARRTTHTAIGGVFLLRTAEDPFTTWTPALGEASKVINRIGASSLQYVAAGSSGQIWVSDHSGNRWGLRTSGTTQTLTSVVCTSTLYVMVGFGGVILTSQ